MRRASSLVVYLVFMSWAASCIAFAIYVAIVCGCIPWSISYHDLNIEATLCAALLLLGVVFGSAALRLSTSTGHGLYRGQALTAAIVNALLLLILTLQALVLPSDPPEVLYPPITPHHEGSEAEQSHGP